MLLLLHYPGIVNKRNCKQFDHNHISDRVRCNGYFRRWREDIQKSFKQVGSLRILVQCTGIVGGWGIYSMRSVHRKQNWICFQLLLSGKDGITAIVILIWHQLVIAADFFKEEFCDGIDIIQFAGMIKSKISTDRIIEIDALIKDIECCKDQYPGG